MPYTAPELAKVVAEVRRPYQQTIVTHNGATAHVAGRDFALDRWRATRHRRYKPWIPEGLKVLDEQDLWFNDPLPEFVINRLAQRLGANPMQVAVHLRGEAGPTLQRRGETLENWFRGVMEELDPIGRMDARMREHQAGDGKGYFELELKPGYVGPTRREGESDKDYDKRLDDGRRSHGLPVCLNAPDPRSIYDVTARDQLIVVVKVVDVPLVDVRDSWSAHGFRLGYDGNEKGELSRMMISQDEIAPAPTAAEWGRKIRLVTIADGSYIYHACYQHSVGAGQEFPDDPGMTPTLELLGCYPNPLGHPPFYQASARSTSSADPALRDLPLALEVLEMAPIVNQVRTMRMIHAVIEAQKPIGLKPRMPSVGQENSGPKHFPDMWKFGFMEYDGDFVNIPTTEKKDLDTLDVQVTQAMQSFNTSLMGMAQAGVFGSSTPAWSIQQFNEEQVSLLQEALNTRAVAWKSVLLDVASLVRKKYGKEGPVYVNTAALSKRAPETGHVDLQVGISASDFDIPYRLDVTVGAMTQSQRAINSEYWRTRWLDKTISTETYEDNIGIQDRVAEQARKDREAILEPMRQSALAIAYSIGRQNLVALHGATAEVALAGFPAPMITPEGEGTQTPMQAQMSHGPDMPGQGMATTLNEPNGPRVG